MRRDCTSATQAASRKATAFGKAARFDLHAHTIFSDGSCSALELVDQARAAGLAGIAITDHDCLAQLSRVRDIARSERFPVLAGAEASACDPATGRKIHVLAYGLEATPDESSPLERIMAETRARRTANTLWQAWIIQRAQRNGGLGLDAKCSKAINSHFTVNGAVNFAATSGAVYKQHVMAALVHLPYRDETYQRIYRALFKGDGIANRDIDYPDAAQVVRAIREQGGHPVLAHPGQFDSWESIPALVDAGLEGIEAYHPDHTDDDVAAALDAAARHGLFVTGGSDFHGIYGGRERLGCRAIEAAEAGERVTALFEAEHSLR